MATLRMPIKISSLDSGVPLDLVSNQITSATAPSVGNLVLPVLADGGSDEGVYVSFSVPKNYVGTPKLVVKGILDGAPGASDTLGWGARELIAANNATADGTFAAEQTVSATIGSGGTNHSNEDLIEQVIDLTGTYVVDSDVSMYVYLDASGTSYAGNVLLKSVEFQYADA